VILTPSQRLSRNPSNAGYQNPLRSYSVPATDNPDGTINVPAQPVYLIDPSVEPIPIGQNVIVSTKSGGVIQTVATTQALPAAGAFAQVPPNKEWLLQGAIIDVTATATVGNRVLSAYIQEGATTLWRGPSTAAIAAGQVGGYDIAFGAGAATSTVVRRNLANTANTNVQILCSCPYRTLRQNMILYIQDTAAIDVADATTFRMIVEEFDA